MPNKVKLYRRKKQMSQQELAEKSGLSRVYISYIEVGKIENVGMKTARKIAEALDVDVFELFSCDNAK